MEQTVSAVGHGFLKVVERLIEFLYFGGQVAEDGDEPEEDHKMVIHYKPDKRWLELDDEDLPPYVPETRGEMACCLEGVLFCIPCLMCFPCCCQIMKKRVRENEEHPKRCSGFVPCPSASICILSAYAPRSCSSGASSHHYSWLSSSCVQQYHHSFISQPADLDFPTSLSTYHTLKTMSSTDKVIKFKSRGRKVHRVLIRQNRLCWSFKLHVEKATLC